MDLQFLSLTLLLCRVFNLFDDLVAEQKVETFLLYGCFHLINLMRQKDDLAGLNQRQSFAVRLLLVTEFDLLLRFLSQSFAHF